MRRTSAALASPSLGGAATRALSTARPSAMRSTPSMASRPPLAVSRTASAMPPGVASHGGLTSEHVRIDVADDDVLDEQDDQDHDHRRDVDAAEIGQQIADRAQQRLGDAVEKFAD